MDPVSGAFLGSWLDKLREAGARVLKFSGYLRPMTSRFYILSLRGTRNENRKKIE